MPFFGEKSNPLDYSQIIKELNSQKIGADYVESSYHCPLLHAAIIEDIPQAYRAVVDYYREKYSRPGEKFTFIEAINLKDTTGKTALHHACNQGNYELVKYLMDAGASDKITDNNGNLPLHFAAAKFNFPITEYLLTKRQLNFLMSLLGTESNDNYEQANVGATNNAGMTPLFMAINLFVDEGNVEAKNNQEKVIHALLNSYSDKQLVDEIDVPKPGVSSYFELAISRKLSLSVIEKLLKKISIKIDKQNSEGLTALQLAIITKNKDLVALLLENNADMSIKNAGKTALHLAAEQKNLDAEILELLLEHAASLGQVDFVDNQGNTPFHIALSHCDETIAKLFVDYGANVNAKDMVDNTPLHLAILALERADNDDDSNKHQQVYFYLYGLSDKTLRNKNGRTAEDLLNIHLRVNPEFHDIDLNDSLTESNLDRSNATGDDKDSPTRMVMKLNTAAISSAATTPASTSRSDSDSVKPLISNLTLVNTKPKGFLDKSKNYLLSSWRKFKTTRVGRFVKRHPYISAAIFAVVLTGFVALCVFVPPIAAKIPILLAVTKALTATKILTNSSAILDPIAKTIAMVIPAVAVAITGGSIKLGHYFYSRVTQDKAKNNPVFKYEQGIVSSRRSATEEPPKIKYTISKERVAVHKYKLDKKDFSIRDYLPRFLVSCWGEDEEENNNGVVKNGKEKERAQSSGEQENPIFDATRRENDFQRMDLS